MFKIFNNNAQFKVKHPYSNLITSMFVGIVMFFLSVLSLGSGIFGVSLKAYAYTGLGTGQNPYVINSTEDLTSQTILSALQDQNSYLALGSDITISNTLTTNLRANFDGRGYTITLGSTFVANNYGTIYNTIIKSATNSVNGSALLATNNYGTINKVTISSAFENLNLNGNYVGALVGNNQGTISRIINNQTITNTQLNSIATGGVVGTNSGTVTLVANYGNVVVSGLKTTNDNTYGVAGGIVGVYNAGENSSINNSYNQGEVFAANASNTSTGVGYVGGHAGGIIGAYINSQNVASIYNVINYGIVNGGNGGRGANGVGGQGGVVVTTAYADLTTQSETNLSQYIAQVAGRGGQGGFGGGAGGNASGVIGYASSTQNLNYTSVYNFGSLVSGFGGNGGFGGAGGGAGLLLPKTENTTDYIKVLDGKQGTSLGVGGQGAIVKSTLDNLTVSVGSGGGAGAGGGASCGLVNSVFTITTARTGVNGTNGENGTLTTGGAAGVAGSHYGAEIIDALDGIAGSTGLTVFAQNTYYFTNASVGGNGGFAGIGGNATIMPATYPQPDKEYYEGFDFVSESGWAMTETKPILRFEQGETFINAQVQVYYNGQLVTDQSSNYISLKNVYNSTEVVYQNGVWVDYINPLTGDGSVLYAGTYSSYVITNNGNYIYSVSGMDDVISLSKPSQYGQEITNTFNVSEENFRSNENNILTIIINVYDQLQGQGTQAQPYAIADFYNLSIADVYDSSTTYFMLTNDITEADGFSHTRIINSFMGNLNGNGFSIFRNGLYQKSLITANNGVITNLNIVITQNQLQFNEFVFGALVSENNGTISNINLTSTQSQVNVLGSGDIAYAFGAVVGFNSGTVTSVYSSVNFVVSLNAYQSYTTNRYVGGLVARNQASGVITLSKNTGNIQFISAGETSIVVTAYVGGVSGYNLGTITNVYKIGNVTGYSTGNTQSYVAGIAYSQGVVSYSFTNGQNSNFTTNIETAQNAISTLSGVTAATSATLFADWDFNFTWVYNSYSNQGLPSFATENGNDASFDIALLGVSQASELQSVTTININSYQQLATILTYMQEFVGTGSVNKTIKLTGNISAQGYTLPSATLASNITFDGNGYSISDFRVLGSLFTQNNGTIKNLTLLNGYTTYNNSTYTAGLVGQNFGTLYNVTVNAGVLVNNVQTTAIIGGIVGSTASSLSALVFGGAINIQNSSNVSVGGLVGVASATANQSITNSIVSGKILLENVTSVSAAYLANTLQANFAVSSSYSYGTSNSYSYVAGLVATIAGGSSVANTYILQNTYTGTLASGTTAIALQNIQNSSYYTGFDFNAVWYITPNNYPTLWENQTGVVKTLLNVENGATAYVTAYASTGEYLREITGNNNVAWIFTNSEITLNNGNTNLDQVTGNIKFSVNDQNKNTLGVSMTYQDVTTVLLNLDTENEFVFATTVSNAYTDVVTFNVGVKAISYNITFVKPQIVGVEDSLVGAFTITYTRDGIVSAVTTAYDQNGEFVLSDLVYGDTVTVKYADTNSSNTLSQVNTTFAYLFSAMYANSNLLSTTKTSSGVTYSFNVNSTTASNNSTSEVVYSVNFVELKQVSIQTDFPTATKQISSDPDLAFSVPSVNNTLYTTAYVLSGLQVRVFAPSVLLSDATEHEFTEFTITGAVINDAQNNNYAYFNMGASNVVVTANYYTEVLTVTIHLHEEGTGLNKTNLLHNGIIINDGQLITSVETTIELLPGQNIITLLNGSQTASVDGLTPSATMYLFNYTKSVVPSGTLYYGYVKDSENSVFSFGSPITYENLIATQIVFDLSQDLTGNNSIELYFEYVGYSLFSTSIEGTGTQSNPFKVSSLSNLYYIAYDMETNSNSKFLGEKYFIQTADITNQRNLYELGYITPVFKQIGTDYLFFEGHYDGNGYVIKDLLIVADNKAYVGMFSALSYGASVNNVVLEDVTIINNGVATLLSNWGGNQYYNKYVGSLVGANYGTVSNSAVTSSTTDVTGTITSVSNTSTPLNAYVGGLVGVNYSQVLTSYAKVNISADGYAGGLVGYNANALVSGSYSLSNVVAKYASGLVGRNGTGVVSADSKIMYSYNAGTLTATDGGQAFGITYNFALSAGYVQDILTNSYYLNNVDYGYANYFESGIEGSQTYGVVTQQQLQDFNFVSGLFENTNSYCNYLLTVTSEMNYSVISQHNYGYPLIVTMGPTVSLTINAYYNGEQITSLENLDLNNDYISDWTIMPNINATISIPKNVSYNVVFNAQDSNYSYVSYITQISNDYMFALSGEFGDSTTITLNNTEYDVILNVYFDSTTIEISYLPSAAFGAQNTTSTYASYDQVTNIGYLSDYKNIIITEVYLLVDSNYVLVNSSAISTTMQKAYNGGAYVGVTLQNVNELNGGLLSVYTTNLDIKIRVIAGFNVSLSSVRSSSGDNQNLVTISTNINGEPQQVIQLTESGTQNVVLPFGQYLVSGSDFVVYYSYTLTATRTTDANVIGKITFGNSDIYENVYSGLYDLTNKSYEFNLLGTIPTISTAFLSTTDSVFNITVEFYTLNKLLNVTLNTEFANISDLQLSVSSTQIYQGDSTITFNQNLVENVAVFNINYNQYPTLTISSVQEVAGKQNLFTLNENTYRAIWVVGNTTLSEQLLLQSPDYAFGLLPQFSYPIAALDTNYLTLYIVQVFSVGTIAQLHDTSFTSTTDITEDKLAYASVTSISGMSVSDKALPGAMASELNTGYVDFGSQVTFTSDRSLITNPDDLNRIEFYNWNNETTQTTESYYEISSLQSDVNIKAYYKVKVVKLLISDNVSEVINSVYTKGLNVSINGVTLTLGDLVFVQFSQFDYSTRQYYNYNGKPIMYITVNPLASAKYLDEARTTYYSFTDYGVAYGEYITIEDSDSEDFENMSIRDIELFTLNQDGILDVNYQNSFAATVNENTDAQGIYQNELGYQKGISGKITDTFAFRAYFYERVAVYLYAQGIDTTQTAIDEHTQRFTESRKQINVVEPNGNEVSNDGVNTYTTNEDSHITLKYFVGQNENGLDLSNYQFNSFTIRTLEMQSYTPTYKFYSLTESATINDVYYNIYTQTETVGSETYVYVVLEFDLHLIATTDNITFQATAVFTEITE